MLCVQELIQFKFHTSLTRLGCIIQQILNRGGDILALSICDKNVQLVSNHVDVVKCVLKQNCIDYCKAKVILIQARLNGFAEWFFAYYKIEVIARYSDRVGFPVYEVSPYKRALKLLRCLNAARATEIELEMKRECCIPCCPSSSSSSCKKSC